MNEWRRLCCAVDLSDPSRVAFDEAIALAWKLGAELVLLYVRPPTILGGAVAFAPPPAGDESSPQREELLNEWVERAQRSVPTTSVELSGHPAAEIVRFAAEFSCDLLVVGTHGRTGLRHVALGSVAEQVIRTAPCPVLVVRAPTS